MGLEKLKASSDEAIMVGDSSFDIRCANNAGVTSVLVDWRMTSDDENFEGCRIDYHIAEPMDMVALLEQLKQLKR